MIKIPKKYNLTSILWIGIETLLLLSALFQIGSLQILDEAVGLLSIILIGWRIRIIKRSNVNLVLVELIALLFLLALIGLLSAYVSKKYYSLIYVAEGTFQFLKPFLIFIAAYLSFTHHDALILFLASA